MKATSDFARLARYIVNAQGQIDPLTWKRNADYSLETGEDIAKVGEVRITNCSADEPVAATLEILATQKQNTRSKSDKSYHLVISFAAGERPAEKILHAIEDRFCAAIGMADHQRISAIHTDTDFLHVHVAINKVHPATRRNIEPFYDKNRLMGTCVALEIEHDLQRTNHGQEYLREQIITRLHEEQSHDRYINRSIEHNARDVAALRESYLAAIAENTPSESFNDLRSLSGVSMVSFAKSDQMLLPGDASGELEYRRAEHSDPLRRPDHGQSGQGSESRRTRAESAQTKGIAGRAGDMEAHSGRESLLGWIKRDVANVLIQATDWQELHKATALHGLEIKPRGAGLVLATQDGNTAVKASDVDRRLSLTALTKRFGPFEPVATNATDIHAAKQYRQSPRQPHAKTANLFSEYQQTRVSAQQTRQVERNKLREEYATYKKNLTAYYARKRDAIKRSPMTTQIRRTAYKNLANERAQDAQQRKTLEAAQRSQISERNPLPVWQEWLTQRASAGNTDALAVLRTNNQRKKQFLEDWLTASNSSEAKTIVYEHMKPYTDKTGTVHYTVADGGVVKDTAKGVRVDQSTEASAFLGLLLATEKYAGQALIVEGSDAFKDAVARMAGSKGMPVQFADAGMEQKRQAASSAGQILPKNKKNQVIDDFVEKRNEQRKQIPTIAHHRQWTPQDAGEANYEGRRQLSDGSEAVLLKKGNTVLVMSASSAQTAKASMWKKGQQVTTDIEGRLTGEMKHAKTNDKGKKR